jgi:hypothetical protein
MPRMMRKLLIWQKQNAENFVSNHFQSITIMLTNEYTINNIAQLKELSSYRDKSIYLKMELDFLPACENEAYSEKINRYRNACGCTTGKYFLLPGILFCVLGMIMRIELFRVSVMNRLLIALAILFSTAVTGKVTGLIIAQLKLRMIEREIRKAYREAGFKFFAC